MASSKEDLAKNKPKIGVNIRIYEEKPSGIQNFIQGLFTELIQNYPQYQFIFFSTGKKKIEATAQYITAHSIFISILKRINPLLINIFFDNLFVLKLMLSQKLSIFIGPCYILPIMKPKNMKYITVIYDLSYLTYKHNPFNLYMNLVMYMKLNIPYILKRADAIVVPSQYVKNEIIKKYHTDSKKLTVIYGGKDEFFYRVKDDEKIKEIRKKYVFSGEYCFTNATNHERKNIFGLIAAFKNIKKFSDTQLIITGLLPDVTILELKDYIQKLNLNAKVRFFGFVSKDELRTLYSFAKIFIFPSFEEGFGLPILESASCGCLPICSNTGALPEIIGNKNLLFNPRDKNSITQKINQVLKLNQSEYKKELVIVEQHLQKFTWKRTAKEWAFLFNTLLN